MSIPYRHRGLSYVALTVTDLERSLGFYRDLLGLQVSSSGASWVALRCSQRHHSVVLHQGPVAGVRRVAFELETPADLSAARQHMHGLGLEIESIPADELSQLRLLDGFRFRVPECGLCMEYHTQMMHMAAAYRPTVARIERLGHVVLNVVQYDAVVGFLTEKLGFMVSDFVPGMVSFLRCFPNPLHHSFAILSDTTDHLNHVNFMVTDIDDVGRAINRMKKAGAEIVFGPGRHQPSTSIFLYFLDPDGMTVEYSFGMETFDEATAREPRLLEPSVETLDLWGSTPSPKFGKLGVIERLGTR